MPNVDDLLIGWGGVWREGCGCGVWMWVGVGWGVLSRTILSLNVPDFLSRRCETNQKYS